MQITTNSFIDKAINGLKMAAVELEEFQLQLTLGKAEASDKYEEVKRNFKTFIHESKGKLYESAHDLKQKMEELQLQLALGKAETKEVFNEQKKKILNAVQEIENILKTPEDSGYYLKLNNELQKFKIKMEILRLRFELGKLKTEEEFKAAKVDFVKKMDKVKSSFVEKESVVEENWNHFRTELSEAYLHLKKAFTF